MDLPQPNPNPNPDPNPNPNPNPNPDPDPDPDPNPNQARTWVAQLAPLEGAARDAGIAELPEAVQPALRALLGSSNPTIALLRSEGSPEQARFIERAQEGATHAALGKEFGISSAAPGPSAPIW